MFWWSEKCYFLTSTEFQQRDKDPRQDDSKVRSKKRTLEDRIQLKAGSEEKRKSCSNKRDFVPQDQIDRSKKESCCVKCGSKYHQGSDCKYGWVLQTPRVKYTSNHNQEPVHEKARTDKGHLTIRELESEEDSGHE